MNPAPNQAFAQPPSLHTHAILRSLLLERLSWRLLICGASLLSAVFGILAPYAQKTFVDGLFSIKSVDLTGGAPLWAAFGFTLCAQGLSQLGIWLATRESLIFQKSIGDGAFSRLIEGPGGLVGHHPSGEAVSLFAVDVPGSCAILDQALVMVGAMFFPLALSPVALKLVFGIPVWASLAMICGMCLMNLALGFKQSKFFYLFKQLAAERTGLVAEWIQNIRTLRILGWVEAAEAKILSFRKRETVNRKRMVTNGQLMNTLSTSTTFALNIMASAFLIHLRGPRGITPGEILALFWFLGVFLARPLRQLPWSIVLVMDSLSSIRRLERGFAEQVTRPSSAIQGSNCWKDSSVSDSSYALKITNLRLEIGGRELLSDLDLEVKAGQLVALVGEVGSGKSLILKSLMGETRASFEKFVVNGKETIGPISEEVRAQLAFVPQEGFTMSASLRENVLLSYVENDGSPKSHPENYPENYNDAQVLESLEIAQFVPEAERLEDGLDSEIGERGVNLSGGQRQRVGLARAHFANRSIILLDDPLSAVDVDTEAKLIEGLICGAWGNRTRVLVTHRLAVLPRCDRVIFIENGKFRAEGLFEDLLASSKPFADFVSRELSRMPKGELTR